MADIGKAYLQIIPKAEGISGKLSSMVNPAAKSAGIKAGKETGSGMASGIKSAIAGLAIGATVAAGLKSAISEGAKLQQSYGGLETIYGNAASAAKEYAVQAAQAGISANSYAEQAVSFGASLKQAFGGDTAAAAEAANTAILDMADNAAKMGTPIEQIQTAYQGFAKGQYQLLDNLKLGYGGTKEEMQRLLSDAQAITGVEYNIDNLGDVYDAVHVIQGELGLTGVAAAEASSTFSGSLGAMQAAAANLLGTLTTGGDVSGAMTTLLSSIGTFFFDNLLPMLGTLAASLPTAIGTAIQTAIPAIQEKAPGIINAIKNGIITYLPQLAATALQLIQNFGQYLVANLPTLMEKGKEFVINIINGIANALPGLLESAGTMLESFVGFVEQNLPRLAEMGGKMLGEIAEAIITNIPKVVTAVGKLIPKVWQAFWKLFELGGKAATKLLDGLAGGIKSGLSKVLTPVKDMVKKMVDAVEAVKLKLKNIMGKVGNTLYDTWNGIKTKAQTLWNGIKSAITSPIETAKTTVENAVSKIRGIFPISMGKIFSGIKLPHFKISGGQAPWGIGGQGTKPSVGIEWYKRGGIATNPVLYGIGERGNEAIVPLSNPYMRPFAKAVAEEMTAGGNTFNVTVSGAGDPQAVVDELIRRVNLRARTV